MLDIVSSTLSPYLCQLARKALNDHVPLPKNIVPKPRRRVLLGHPSATLYLSQVCLTLLAGALKDYVQPN